MFAMTQKALLYGSHKEFLDALNKHLDDGWRVVPGTFQACTVEQVARDDTKPEFVTPHGTVFMSKHFIAIERPKS